MTVAAPPPLLWGTWADEELRISLLADADPAVLLRVDGVPADRRYMVRFVDVPGRGARLRTPTATGTRLWRIGGGDPPPVPEPLRVDSSLGSLAPWNVIPLGDARIAGLDGDRIVLADEDGRSVVVPGPTGFAARDVAADENGAVWICGGAPSRPGGRRRRAWAVLQDDETWTIGHAARGSLRHAWRAAAAGAVDEYRSIRRVGRWLVLGAEGGDPDDSSSFVFARHDDGRWYSHRFAHDTLREVVVDGAGMTAFSHRAGLVRFRRGRRPARRTLADDLVEAVAGTGAGTDVEPMVETLGVTGAPTSLLLLVGLRHGPERLGEAVVAYDGHRVGPLVAYQPPTEPEVVAIWSPSATAPSAGA